MKKTRIATIILGVIIIIISLIMPFHLKYVCYKFSIHQDWTLGAWNAVQIYGTMYGIAICILTIILVLLNVSKKQNKP